MTIMIKRRSRLGVGGRLAAGAVLVVLLVAIWRSGWLPMAWQPLHGNLGEAVPSKTQQGSAGASPSRSSGLQPPRQPLRQQGRRHGAVQSRPQAATAEMRRRCEGTLGNWCLDFETQVEVPARSAPRGTRSCSLDCNKVGTCNALAGLCTCPAGWTGFNCLHPMKRYCTHKHREYGFDVERVPANLSVGLPGHAPEVGSSAGRTAPASAMRTLEPVTALPTPPMAGFQPRPRRHKAAGRCSRGAPCLSTASPIGCRMAARRRGAQWTRSSCLARRAGATRQSRSTCAHASWTAGEGHTAMNQSSRFASISATAGESA